MSLLSLPGMPQFTPAALPKMRAIDDVPATRQAIFDKVLQAAQNVPPVKNDRHTLALTDVHYADDHHPTKAEQKQAILGGQSLGRRLRGTWKLTDNTTGQTLDERKQLLATVPHMTEFGTFIYRGNKYNLRNQQRLRPGIFTREKETGEIEAHVNVLPGNGFSHRYFLDPKKGLFYARIGQAKVPLMPLLRSLGASDQQLKEAWGPELFQLNSKEDSSKNLDKLYERAIRNGQKHDPTDVKQRAIKEAFEKMRLDKEVTHRTLGHPHEQLGLDAVLATTRKLLDINRGHATTDDRDSLPYQTVLGPEDLFAERVARDAGNVRRQLLWKNSFKGHLRNMPAGALQRQVMGALLRSGLGACFDPLTYVLTGRGFVPWPEVTLSDVFACRIDGRLEWHPASKLHVFDYCGPMYGARTKRFSYLVTPNHRCFVRPIHRPARGKIAEYGRAFAVDVHGKHRVHLTTLGALKSAVRPEVFEIGRDVFSLRHGHRMWQHVVRVELWAQFLGWWLAEGSAFIEKSKTGIAYTVTIAQSESANPEYCREISTLLTAMGLKWRRSSNGVDFVIRDKRVWTEVMKCGVRKEKRIPRYAFGWTEDLLHLLWTSFYKGDGHRADDGSSKSETTAPGLALDLVELEGRLGGTGRFSVRYLSRKNPNWADSFVVYSGKSVETSVSLRHNKRDGKNPYFIRQYIGKVYCATVPGGLLYVMRDGKPHWSSNSAEEINPLEVFDKLSGVSRMGVGGLPSLDAVPDDSRMVSPSHLGYMDLVRTPESSRVGIDTNLAGGVRKGEDGKIYARFKDFRTGQEVWKSPQEAADLAVAFPESKNWPTKRVPVLHGGRTRYLQRHQIDLELPAFEEAFSSLGNLVPMKSAAKAQRMAMAARMLTQAMPLEHPEAPWVQSGMPGQPDRSYEEEHGKRMGTVHSNIAGTVMQTTPDAIVVRGQDGMIHSHELYNNFPFNRKTSLHNTSVVQPGQVVNQGDLLAKSNYTDDKGAVALGRNLRTAYLAANGMNFEDAVVISQSAAEKLKSEHTYQHAIDWSGDDYRRGKKTYLGTFPSRFSKDLLRNIDDEGVIKPGTEVHYGDPLVLATHVRSTAQNKVYKQGQPSFVDASLTWDHHDPGVVTDAVMTDSGPNVVVKSYSASKLGDKLAGRHGNKGVIGGIIPDAQMPHNQQGEPMELLLNPLGVISRGNAAQIIEAALGKVAAKTGKPYKIGDFDQIPNLQEFAEGELRKHGLSDTEDLIDPATGQKIPQVMTGSLFHMKLQHEAEDKGQSRGSGGYSQDDTPAKGGATGAKRVSILDSVALLSHGVPGVSHDAGMVRGQKNEDYWMQYMQGYNPTPPKVPKVWQSYVNHLKGAGINVIEEGSQLHMMALTNKDIDHLAGDRELQNAETVRFDNDLTPIPGGLFDPGMTGAHRGSRWAKITLSEPMPSPVMEDPIRRMLGLTKNGLEDVIAGKKSLATGSGPAAIYRALDAIDVPRELGIARSQITHGARTTRDKAIRRLAYLKSAEKLGIHPRDWMLKAAPVLPPAFRPVSMMSDSNIPLVADPNYLYKELFDANTNLKDMTGRVGEGNVGDERLAVYRAFKAVTGLGDPMHPKLVEKNVKGILQHVLGSSPKFSMVQRKLIGSTVDNVGRAVVTPNPDLDMDSIGIPEQTAWNVYQKHVIRRLHRRGLPITEAIHHWKEQDQLARSAMLEEMDERPVIVARAPVLHKFGILAFRPQLVQGSTVHVSPQVVKGFGMDFDGDAVQFHVVQEPEAVRQAYDKMLPSRSLLSPADFHTPVHQPSQEYAGGLWSASRAPTKKQHTRYFASKADALRAFSSGEITADTPIKILG